MLLKRLNCGNEKEIHGFWYDVPFLFYHCNSLFFSKKQSKRTLHVCCVCTAQIANLETRNSEYCHCNCIYMQKCSYVSISSVGFFFHFPFCKKNVCSISRSNGTKCAQVTKQCVVFSIYEDFWLNWFELMPSESAAQDAFSGCVSILKKQTKRKQFSEHIKIGK